MRIILAGSPAERARLKVELESSGFQVVGEFASLAAAQRSGLAADAFLVAPPAHETEAEDEDEIVEPLTGREIQVLELLAEGLPNKAIADRLGISDQTVKFHVASISGKLGAANRTDAVRRAVRRGLIAL
jgi:DNA-binding NarL/FixJ family response regulator